MPGLQPGLTNIGKKPTFQGQELTVETHLPGFHGDLYGARLELQFLHRLREEQRFDNVDALRTRITADVRDGLDWWNRNRAGRVEGLPPAEPPL